MDITADEIVSFWRDDVGPDGWYKEDPALDAAIRTRFEPIWRDALENGTEGWQCAPRSTLALLILFDQFPRNMFRGSAEAFASDARARKLAKKAISAGHDMATEPLLREFYYMPLEHSECLADQDQAVRLIAMNIEGEKTLRHAKAHREIIRKFGRFPFRNEALGRTSTSEETAFLALGGYAEALRSIAA